MVYDYLCHGCGETYEVIKSVRFFDAEEHCPKSGTTMARQFAPGFIYLSGTKVQEAEYNPGLGCITKNKQHVKEICKQRGLVEVGNTSPETLHKMHDQERERRREQAWASVDKGWVGSDG